MTRSGEIRQTAERRQVTMLHCDIVNSSAYVTRFDPEETLAMMQAYVDKCRAVVEAYNGTFVTYTGDGFQAYFGYPIAHDDDAVDAVSAALELMRMLDDHDENLPESLVCRIGVATGRVVISQPDVRQMGQHLVAYGSTAHLATRLEQAAKPGSILIDRVTRSLCTDRFVLGGATHIDAKGFDNNIEAWEVLRHKPTDRRFAAASLSPFVARQRELDLLKECWANTLSDSGQTVLVSGSSGVGKSRLVYEFKKNVPRDQVNIYQFQCSRQHTSTPLHPWIHNVQRFANLTDNDCKATRRVKLRNYLIGTIGLPESILEPAAQLFGLLDETEVDHKEMSAEQMLQKLQRALVNVLLEAAKHFPVLVLVEDIQWIDASTLNVVNALLEAAQRTQMLLVLTSRINDQPALAQGKLTRVDLSALESVAVRELVNRLSVVSEHQLTATETEAICNRCDGNPLFIEELTKHALSVKADMQTNGEGHGSEELVPNVLQGPLLQRLDRSGDGKAIAQVAAVIGAEFDAHLITHVLDDRLDKVTAALESLVRTGILSESSFGERTHYTFRHALLQDVVYTSLLNSFRTQTHLQIARHIADDDTRTESGAANIVAWHFQCGGDHDRAFQYWLVAGDRALESGATREAVNTLENAVKLVPDLEETDENLRGLAKLYSGYGYALNACEGVAAGPIEHFEMAEKLYNRLGDIDGALEAMDWQFGLHFNAGELRASEHPARRMKQLGTDSDYALALVSGCQALGMSKFTQGRFVEAREEFEEGLAAGADLVSGPHCFPSMSLSYLAWTHHFLNNPTEAETYAARAIASSRDESSHALAAALSNCCFVYECLGEVDKVRENARELVMHAEQYGENLYVTRAHIHAAWAAHLKTPSTGSIARIRQYLDQLLEAREEIDMTFLLGLLAELEIRAGLHDDAASTLDQALSIVAKTQENFYLAELYRLKALLQDSAPVLQNGAEEPDYLMLARETAKRQGAKALMARIT